MAMNNLPAAQNFLGRGTFKPSYVIRPSLLKYIHEWNIRIVIKHFSNMEMNVLKPVTLKVVSETEENKEVKNVSLWY